MAHEWVRWQGTRPAREVGEAPPFVIGIVGSFSAERERTSEAALGFVDVDRDTLDSLFAELAAELSFELDGSPFRLAFASFEDLRPEALALRLPQAAPLRDRSPPDLERRERAAGRELLAELLGERRSEPARRESARDPAIERLVRAIADATPGASGPAASERDALDPTIARVRGALRDPRFRALDASWRSLRDLVRRAETGPSLRLRVLDLGSRRLPDELAALRAACEDPGAPVSLLVVDAAVDFADLPLLEALGNLAEGIGAQVLTGASPAWLDAAASGALRESAARRARGAKRVHVLGPRALARLPFGPGGDAVEGFELDETAEPWQPALACWASAAYVGARAVLARLQDPAARGPVELSNLPQFTRAGSAVGPAERLLDERERALVREAGLLPVSGARNSDSVWIELPFGARSERT
jgi:type VI secretion system protein ImpC